MSLEREFGKELAADTRKETADKIREVRKRPHSFKDLQKEKNIPSEYERPYIKEGIEALKKNIFGRIFKTEKFRRDQALLNETLQSKKEWDIKAIKEDYEKKFKEILKNSPLTQEEKEKYLSTEAMEKMNLEDFDTLADRLSGEAFYHVTRYGVRENTFQSTGGGHNVGKGRFVDNFTPLIKDGYIKDCTTTVISDHERANSLANEKFIQKEKEAGTPVEEVVDQILSSYNGSQYFLDRESSHFSYGEDLHHMYGGENNYKFYVYYPVEYILQNDFYHKTRESITIGKGYAHNRRGIDQQYNDFEIFNFGEGVPINAGVLCITGDIQVDPETGSQYVLKDGKPVIGEDGEFEKPEKTISSQEYWENYFALHPELKPSKVVYGGFYTHADRENPDLEDWAKSKNIHEQDESKQQEFLDYQKRVMKELRQRITEVVTEKYKEEESEV